MGKIRLGKKGKSAKGKEYPQKLDYFRMDPDDESLLPTLHKQFGEKPKRLPVMFVSSDREEIFPQYLKKYGTSGLLCKGTGGKDENGKPKPVLMRVTAVDEETGEVTISDEYPCDPDNCEDYKSGRCKRLASLCGFILSDHPGLRTWQIDTTSKISIENLNSRLDQLRELARSIGKDSIAGVPLVLSLNPVQVRPEGKKRKQTVYVMDLDLDTNRLMQQGPMLAWLGRLAAGGQLAAPAIDEGSAPDGLYMRSQVDGADPVQERIELTEEGESDEEADPVLANLPDDIAEGMRAIGLTKRQVRNLVLRYLEPGETELREQNRRNLYSYLNGLADMKAAGDEASFQANVRSLDIDDVEEAETVDEEPEETPEAGVQDGQTDAVKESVDVLGLADI